MQTKSILLFQLGPSPTNARKRYDKPGLESLAASIQAHGLIYPLLVRPNGKAAGHFQVEEGGRRFRALQLLAKAGHLPFEHPVACIEIAGDDAAAFETGIAANVERADFHPAEEVEAFARLAAGGSSAAEIAARFGIPERRVRQRLALGSLSPRILKAWLEGQLGNNAAETAQAFTLAPSPGDQERVFDKLRKAGALYPHVVRRELGAEDRSVGPALTFVGREAYEAQAGGHVIEDLFGENSVVSDRDLLARLVLEKLRAEAAELVTHGWSWASPESDLEGYECWSWVSLPGSGKREPTPEEAARMAEIEAEMERLEVEEDPSDFDGSPQAIAANNRYQELEVELAALDPRTPTFSAEDMARSGCVVAVDYQGKLDVRFAVIKPKPGRNTSKAPGSKKGKENAALAVSGALMHRLSITATEAARTAIVAEPRLGLAALLAGFRTYDHASPIKVRMGERVWSGGKTVDVGGFYADRDGRDERFGEAFAEYVALPDNELLRAASSIAARALDVQIVNGTDGPLAKRFNAALIDAIEPARLNTALRDRFDPADYFKSVRADVIVKAIGEALGSSEIGKGMKKADLVKLAVEKVPATGWLPAELRTAHYDGPGSAKAAAAKPAALAKGRRKAARA